MTEIVQVKTPLELQEYIWKDGALVRVEDLQGAQIIYIREHSERLKISLTRLPDELDLVNLQPMWG